MHGRIAASETALALCCTSRFSSVRVKSTMALSVAGGAGPATSRDVRPGASRDVRPGASGPATGVPRILDRPPPQEPSPPMTTDASIDHSVPSAASLTPVLGRYFQRTWSHGAGHRLYDTDGRAYLDFANGIAATALGHAHPRD